MFERELLCVCVCARELLRTVNGEVLTTVNGLVIAKLRRQLASGLILVCNERAMLPGSECGVKRNGCLCAASGQAPNVHLIASGKAIVGLHYMQADGHTARRNSLIRRVY